MGLERRTALAIAGLNWSGCIIDVIRELEEPAVVNEVPVIHDYFSINSEPPHNTLSSDSSTCLWCIDDICARKQDLESFLVQSSAGDVPADVPWICRKVLSINEESHLSNVVPISTLIVLAEKMNAPWCPSGEQEQQLAAAFRESKINSIFLVRVDAEGVYPLEAARTYSAFRHVAKTLGGVCAAFRRENISDVAKIAGHHAVGLTPILTKDSIRCDFSKRFLVECLDAFLPR